MRQIGVTYRDERGRARPLLPNTVLPHPFLHRHSSTILKGQVKANRERFLYRFLRVTRLPTGARPFSGKILVENVSTSERREFYAHVFDINWR